MWSLVILGFIYTSQKLVFQTGIQKVHRLEKTSTWRFNVYNSKINRYLTSVLSKRWTPVAVSH